MYLLRNLYPEMLIKILNIQPLRTRIICKGHGRSRPTPIDLPFLTVYRTVIIALFIIH
jgi:hypothetical protein